MSKTASATGRNREFRVTPMPRLRSWLLCPADVVGQYPTVRPDALILDLEATIPDGRKADARRALGEYLGLPQPPVTPLYIRVNHIRSTWFYDDIALVESGRVAGVILPRWETDEELATLDAALCAAERQRPSGSAPSNVVLLVETAAGIRHCRDAKSSVTLSRSVAVAFGANDYASDIGIDLDWSPQQLLMPRTAIVRAMSRFDGVALDTGYGPDSIDGLRRDAQSAHSLGFSGKICIRPDQVEVINEVFSARATNDTKQRD